MEGSILSLCLLVEVNTELDSYSTVPFSDLDCAVELGSAMR